jgi:hypothetical protein
MYSDFEDRESNISQYEESENESDDDDYDNIEIDFL